MTAPRLSFHTERTNLDFDAKIAWLAAVQPRLVKVCEPDGAFCAEVKRVSPNTLILGRDLSDGGTVRDKWNRYRARSDYAYLDIIEGPNEWKPQLGIIGRDNAAYELELCRLAQANGKRYCALSWSEGEPTEWWNDQAQFDEFLRIWGPVLLAAEDIGLHEYWWPDWDTPAMLGWHVLRWPKWYNRLPAAMRKPIIISEANWDGDIERLRPGAGWRDILSPQRWAERTVAYERACPLEIFAITLFNWAGWQWERFEIASGMDALRDRILAEGGNGDMAIVLPDWIADRRADSKYVTGHTRAAAPTGIMVHHAGREASLANLVAYFLRGESEGNYHFLVGYGGETVCVNDLPKVVWHARDGVGGRWNRDAIAVCFQGLFEVGEWPTDAQLAAFRQLRAWLTGLTIFQVGSEIGAHWMTVPSTQCPGAWWPKDAPMPAQLLEAGQPSELERLRVENAELRVEVAKRRSQVAFARARAQDIVNYLSGGVE